MFNRASSLFFSNFQLLPCCPFKGCSSHSTSRVLHLKGSVSIQELSNTGPNFLQPLMECPNRSHREPNAQALSMAVPLLKWIPQMQWDCQSFASLSSAHPPQLRSSYHKWPQHVGSGSVPSSQLPLEELLLSTYLLLLLCESLPRHSCKGH